MTALSSLAFKDSTGYYFVLKAKSGDTTASRTGFQKWHRSMRYGESSGRPERHVEAIMHRGNGVHPRTRNIVISECAEHTTLDNALVADENRRVEYATGESLLLLANCTGWYNHLLPTR